MNYITKRAFLVIMIVFIALITVNNTVFLHMHILPGGEIVYHAHPFKANAAGESSDSRLPGKDHTHSKTQYLIYDQAQQFLPWITLTTLLVISLLIVRLFLPAFHFPLQFGLSKPPTRGPPLDI